LGHKQKGLMVLDDVGLLNPRQARYLSMEVHRQGIDVWRAFTHAHLVNQHREELLEPFHDTGGRRIGMGLETGSQKSLDLINKRGTAKQLVKEHYDAVTIANRLGIAVDAFTMVYPWEDEADLEDTTRLVHFVLNNPVAGKDVDGKQLRNNIDSTIMAPYEGTKFNTLIREGKIPGVSMKEQADPGLLFYKGVGASSGWVYDKSVLPHERYEEEQHKRQAMKLR
jgi:radical SAM superfamily enzyme YgiQ (UPF0313 family)